MGKSTTSGIGGGAFCGGRSNGGGGSECVDAMNSTHGVFRSAGVWVWDESKASDMGLARGWGQYPEHIVQARKATVHAFH